MALETANHRPQAAASDRMPGRRATYLIVFASGFAGLGYEMVWTRMLALSLGHEIVAVLAVLAAFFAGLSIGAFALGERIRRSDRPARWYAVLEILIGAWAIALVWLIPLFNGLVAAWIGEQPSPFWHWSVAFGSTLLLLLPATAAMGATLPALERIFVVLFGPGRHVGGLYAANTIGAVLGTLLTTFVLVPTFGFAQTLWLCALVNLACAAGILQLARQPTTNSRRRAAATVPGVAPAARNGTPLLATLFFTGLLGLAYEVLVVRVLSQVLEDTVFTFAVILSTYLLGTAAGAAFYQARLAQTASERLLARLLILASTACLAGLATLWAADSAYDWLALALERSFVTAISGEVALALMVFLLPTVAMGMLFSHLAQAATPGLGLGRAVALNALGASLAPILAGILLLPAGGAQVALLVVALGYLLPLIGSPGRIQWPIAVPVGIAVALALLPPLRFVGIPRGGELIDYRDGVMASVAVVSDADATRYLKVNNHFTMGSTSSRFADHRQTHIPLLLHDDPRRVLYLGIGTGMTLNGARYHPDLEVTAVDLVPETLDLLHHFGTDPRQNDWPSSPRLLASDARRFVVAGESTFDVIIADQFHPSRDGAGALYTREHFEAVKQRLAPGGLFCQWLPLFQMDLETFRLIARTFADRFPYVQAHLAHNSLQQPVIGLIGAQQPLQYARDRLIERVPTRPLQRELVDLRLNSDLALYGGFIGDRDALLRLARPGELNTDDRTLVVYRAPAFAYRQQQGHAERLVKLVETLAAQRGTLLRDSEDNGDEVFARRLADYWRARDVYLRAGLGVSPADDLMTLLAKTREPLLDVLRISDDFPSAYAPLLAMAESLNSVDPQAARDLLIEVDQAAPARSGARRLLRALEQR